MKQWSALKTGLMPAEFTSDVGENGLFGSGSDGSTFWGCCTHVSQEPSNSETRNRLSLNSAVSLSFNPGTGTGIAVAGFGRGPGSLALNHECSFCASMADVPTATITNAQAAKLLVTQICRFILPNLLETDL